MKSFLVLVVLASMLFVPASRAVPPPETQFFCNSVVLDMAPIGGTANWFSIFVGNTHGQSWYLIHGAPDAWLYHGCFLYEQPTYVFGPYTGNLTFDFQADPSFMSGNWQVIATDASSNAEGFP